MPRSISSLLQHCQDKLDDMKKQGLLDPQSSSFKNVCGIFFEDISAEELALTLVGKVPRSTYNYFYMAMNVKEVADKMISVLGPHEAEHKLYNYAVGFFHLSSHSDNYGTIFDFNSFGLRDEFLLNLRSVVTRGRLSVDQLTFCPCGDVPNILFRNLLQCGFGGDEIMKSLHPSQLLRTHKAISEIGFDLIPDGVKLSSPTRAFKDLSREQLAPIYTLLSRLHGPYEAQMLLNSETEAYDRREFFLKKEDLPIFSGIDSQEKTLLDIFENSDFRKRGVIPFLEGIVSAYRNSDCLRELDFLPEKITARLIRSNLLNADDLMHMPKTRRNNLRLSISNDFSI